MDFEKQELLEFSIVPVPANADCLVEARAAGIDVEPLREWAAKTLERLGGAPSAEHVIATIGLGNIVAITERVGDVSRTYSIGSPPASVTATSGFLQVFQASNPPAPKAEHEYDDCPKGDDCPMRGKAMDECPMGDDCPMKKKAVAAVVTRPLPGEHACRLRDPAAFQDDSFRRMEREHDGKAYAVIMGRLTGEQTMTEQAYRYPKDDWTADAARGHCGSHDGSFEAAAGEAGADMSETANLAIREIECRVSALETALAVREAVVKEGVIVDDDIGLDAMPYEVDELEGISAEQVAVALRDVIGSEVAAGMRRVMNDALGRVD